MSSINMPWSSSYDEVQPAQLPWEAEGIWATVRTDIQRGLGHSTSLEYTAAGGKLRSLQAKWLASWHDAQSSEPVVATESEPLLDRGGSSSARPPLKVRCKGRSKQRKAGAEAEELPVAADEAEAVSEQAAVAAATEEARVVGPVKKQPATGAELQARRKQVACEGYSLSGRDFAHRRAVKAVCPDDALAPGDKERFLRGTTQSKAMGGCHKHVLRERTCALHWDTYRRYVGFLALPERVRMEDALTEERVTKYFCQLENAASSRKTPFAPGTVNLIARSLSALATVAFRTAGIEKKVAEERAESFLQHIRSLSRSVQDSLARKGDKKATVRTVLRQERPKTLDDMLASRAKFVKKAAALKNKIKKLAANAPEGNRRYMEYRHARMRAGILANDFLMQTSERPHTVHSLVYGHRLDYASEEDWDVTYMPLGAEPDKNSTKDRLKRGQWAKIETLTPTFGKKLWKYVNTYLPIIEAHHGYDTKPDVDEEVAPYAKALFAMFEPSFFRKRVLRPVAGAGTNDIRAHIELQLKAAAGKHGLDTDIVQAHVNHTKPISDRHYAVAQQEKMKDLISSVLPGM